MSRRFAPRRGVDSSPGQELLGVISSHGPSRESYKPSQKSSGGPAEAKGPPGAAARVSAQGVRRAFSSPASAPALLQRGVPPGGPKMVAVEGPGAIPGRHGRQTETERAKPALPGARPKPETTRERGSWRGREGNHYRRFFSIMAATGQAATSDSHTSGEVLCNASVRTPAGVRWSGSKSGSGAGSRRAFNPEILIHLEIGLTFSLSDATGVSPTRSALGAPAGAPSGAAAAAAGLAGRSGAANAHRGGGRRRLRGPLRGHRRL